MSGANIVANNAPSSISARYAASALSWWPVLVFLPARLFLAFLAQSVVAALVGLSGATDPWKEAAAWWPVYSTITDILCLLSLSWLTRREGIKLLDLVGVRGRAVLRELAWTPAYLLAIAPAAALASLVTQLFYGPVLPPMIVIVDLPLAGALYSVVIWPVIWVVAEELVYLGYLFPRVEALSGKSWLAVLIVTFFWGLQHLAIPFIGDGTYLLSRVLAASVAVGGITLVYVLWRRRLVPIIGAHYLFDLSTGFLVGLFPLLRG